MNIVRGFTAKIAFVFLSLSAMNCLAGNVAFHDEQLWIDGVAQPQIYGAEIQYFRLRGGPGPNVPRAEVIALWNQALDRAVEAGMNAVSFYIPWDFHEYAEGKFDFDGTADDDGDGLADYPSRDVRTFIKLIEEHGIKIILARPGPYINAEWGFLGFGAIPLWFHEKYPDSHSKNSKRQSTTLFSYEDPDFLRLSKIWLETVYHQVLKDHIGPGKPVSFIQIDNETNFMWQSIYSHDYGVLAVREYQDFLQSRYLSLASLNNTHGREWKTWSEIRPPFIYSLNLAEDQDWYRYQDHSLYSYLQKIRKVWTDLGVKEPTVHFTLAESYNATEAGLLPNYKLRNAPDVGMLTVNLYPKTYETADKTLLNLPFKADHDVKAAAAASEAYLGTRQDWVMGPEIQGGWWKGTHVSEEARRQTYLTTIGHGMKALFIYYFNEGENWQSGWMKTAITGYFNELKKDPKYASIAEKDLPYQFWSELDQSVANQFLAINTQNVWINGGTQTDKLYFDAPIGGDAKARAPFQLVKDIGNKLVKPYGAFLGQAHELEDPVCLVKDPDAHVPSGISGVNSRIVQSDWSGGLLALLMHSGINARIHHWGINQKTELLDLKKCKMVLYQDTGLTPQALVETLQEVTAKGGSVVSFIYSGTADALKASPTAGVCSRLPSSPMEVDGYKCQMGAGNLYYVKVAIYDVFNTDFYSRIHDANQRRGVIDRILDETGIVPKVKINGGGDRTVTFARANQAEDTLWITAKTSRIDGTSGNIQWSLADSSKKYSVLEVLTGREVQINGDELVKTGFPFQLEGSGSSAYFVRAL
ncbi:MAG: beta-galactosidase [Bdellovibrionaceae bacterium]|nr:beta-galactosidase [Pseudobdellovibrionaceae bacterium]